MRTLTLTLAAGLLTACPDLVWLEARAEAVCHHLPAQRFELPPDARGQAQETFGDVIEVARDFVFDVRGGLSPELQAAASTRVRLTSVDVTAQAPTQHFGFVDEARVVLLPPEGSALQRRELAWVREAEEPRAIGWRGEPLDVMAWLEAGALRFSLAFVGRVPEEEALVAAVDVCAEASVALTMR